jgi:hypothetical protein
MNIFQRPFTYFVLCFKHSPWEAQTPLSATSYSLEDQSSAPDRHLSQCQHVQNRAGVISPPAQCNFLSLEVKRQDDTVHPSTTASQRFASMPLYTSVVTCSVSRTLQKIRLVILTAVTIFWDVKTCRLTYVYRCFRRTCCLHYQVVDNAENSSKTSVHLYQAIRRHTQNYGSLQLPYIQFENICKPRQLKRYTD